ncbi:MAG: hypothetical protein EPO22_02405 [Dehalococcoidia bacterium]|nr:MAG: hypothetical protein EPO22_02405 [Dehalococcoidia bacterium]
MSQSRPCFAACLNVWPPLPTLLEKEVINMVANGEKLSTILVGIAGEYLVAGELSRRGYKAAVTLRNTKGVDIYASSEKATRPVGIQVKTTRSTSVKQWWLGAKADNDYRDDLFYIFVNLNDGEAPTYHIVPSETVARFSRHWLHWMKAKNERSRAFKDSGKAALTFWPNCQDQQTKGGVFLDRWDLLGPCDERRPVADLVIECPKCTDRARRAA